MIIQEMQEYYDLRAHLYDSSMGYDDLRKIEELQPVIERVLAIFGSRRVLEVACGPCFWTQFAARHAKSLVASDFNESTLQEALKKELPWEKVQLIQADAYQLEKIPGDFDAIFAVDWLAHVSLDRMDSFLQAAVARVPAGSPIVFIDQLPGAHSLTSNKDELGNHIQTRELPDGRIFSVIKHFFSDGELEALFSRISGNLRIERFPECRRIMVTFMPRPI